MAPKYDEFPDSAQEDAAPGLDELVTNPYDTAIPRKDVVRVALFGYRICNSLNRSVSKQEEYYIKPAGFTSTRRYEDHYRVHGRSMIVMDMWSERGIEIQLANLASVDEVITLIKQRQYLDMTRGTLNGPKTLSRILINVEKMLEDPVNMLILPFQWTKSFKARKTENPDYIAVEDLREFAGRRGDVRPLYWVRISWLFTNWNLIHYIWGCSCIYDNIRDGLYEAVPMIKNHPNVQEIKYRGNRFTITMGEPEVWHVYDRAVQKRSYLWNVQVYNPEFDVPKWYLFDFSIYDYDRKLFCHLTGTKPSKKKRGKRVAAVEHIEEPKQEVNVSSSGVSDDEGSDVARTLNQDEVTTEEFDSVKHSASQSESAALNPSSLATFNMRPREALGPRERLRKDRSSTYSD